MSQQRYNDTVTADVGLVVPTYRGIPLVKSSFLQARGYAMSTVTATASSGALPGGLSTITGSLGNHTYYYVVTAVIARQGEIQPCAEVSAATGGTSGFAKLAFTAPTGQDGSQPIMYKVYRATSTSGAETFLGYVDAVVGLGSRRRDPDVRDGDLRHRGGADPRRRLGDHGAGHPVDGVLRHQRRVLPADRVERVGVGDARIRRWSRCT